MTNFLIKDNAREITLKNVYEAWVCLYPELEYTEFLTSLLKKKLRRSISLVVITTTKRQAHVKSGQFKGSKCICIETGEIFDSITDAAMITGVSRPLVSRSCSTCGCTVAGGKHFIRV